MCTLAFPAYIPLNPCDIPRKTERFAWKNQPRSTDPANSIARPDLARQALLRAAGCHGRLCTQRYSDAHVDVTKLRVHLKTTTSPYQFIRICRLLNGKSNWDIHAHFNRLIASLAGTNIRFNAYNRSIKARMGRFNNSSIGIPLDIDYKFGPYPTCDITPSQLSRIDRRKLMSATGPTSPSAPLKRSTVRQRVNFR